MYTIEAALCTGLALFLVGLLLIQGPAVYALARDTAVSGALAAQARVDLENMYKTETIRFGSCSMPSISTSPVSLHDLVSAADEALDVFIGWMDQILPANVNGLSSDTSADQED